MISRRAANLKTSPTLALVAKAKELASLGHPVISLTVGEPDWATFPIAAKAGKEAIDKGITKYTAAHGTVELRKAIAQRSSADLKVEFNANEVTVASGAKFIVFAALQMLCDPGDEVIISAPYWVSYPTMIELADAKPVIVECDQRTQFKLLAADLQKAITPKTKVFLFCSPSNPTGLAYSVDELKDIAEVLRVNPQVMVISDDMYNRLMFGKTLVAPHLLHVAPDLKNRIIAVNGGSKAYSMTGWRIGWGVGPQAVIKAMADYQSQSTGSPSSIAQYAVEKAILQCEPDIAEVNRTLEQRKTLGLRALQEIPEFKVATPEGAFYFWVDIQKALNKSYKGTVLKTSKQFCDVLLNDFFVATVPGIECGTEGYMRLSFAIEAEKFVEATARMKKFLSECV